MKRIAIFLFLIVGLSISLQAQTAPRTLVKTVATLPATCTTGVPQTEEIFKTGAGAGLYYCDPTGHWALVVTANVPGIFQINGMTGSAQVIAIGTSGSAPNVASSSDTTTINVPVAGVSTIGTVSISTQSFTGAKTFANDATFQGKLGIGTTPTVELDVSSAGASPFVRLKGTNTSGVPAFRAINDDSSARVDTFVQGHSTAGSFYTNGPANASLSAITGRAPNFAISQTGSDGSIWFATNGVYRAKLDTAGLTLTGSTSGTATIKPQAAASTYTFELPNVNPTVGQNVYVSGFSGSTVTLDYQDGGSSSTGLYDLMGSADGVMSPNQLLLNSKAARAFTLAVTGSVCGSEVAATSQTDFAITVNGVNKGTLRFAASGTSCTVVSPVGTSIAINDKIKIVGPASPDATLSGVTFSLKSSTPDASAYDLGQQANGDLASSQLIMNVKAVRAFTLPITGSVCSAEVAATAQADFIVTVNGVTKGTLRFAAAGTTCSIVSPTSVSVSIGDKIKIIAPATPDATLADVAFTLLGSNP